MRATTLKLIDLLVEQGVLTRAKADQLLDEAQKAGAQTARAQSAEPARAAGWARLRARRRCVSPTCPSSCARN